MDYAECAHCGATVIRLKHFLTSSVVYVDPLPVDNGNLMIDLRLDTFMVMRKSKKGFWQAHVASCSALKGEANVG